MISGLTRASRHRRGDVILFQRPEDNYLRLSRVIGISGDVIYIQNGVVFLNGVKLDELYAMGTPAMSDGQYEVPPESAFVLNDNRQSPALDSRLFGPVPFSYIQGRLGPPVVDITVSVPYPEALLDGLDKFVALTNLVLALIMITLLYMGATIFNSTLKENYQVIRGWYARPADHMRILWQRITHSRGGSIEHPHTWEGVLSVVVPALLYSFLDPTFGLAPGSVVTFVTPALALTVITLAYEGIQVLVSRRRFNVLSSIRLFPAAALIAIGFVILSHSVNFKPGLLYGFVGGYAAMDGARQLKRWEERGIHDLSRHNHAPAHFRRCFFPQA